MSSKLSISDCDYYLLPGKCDANFSERHLYQKAYAFWKEFWIKEMKAAGGDLKYVLSDDFLRQDAVSVLACRGEIVAMALNTVYRIEQPSDRESKFFSIFPPHVLETLDRENCKTVNTIEFLAVNPEWRHAVGGASLGPIFIKLGIMRAQHEGIDVSVGVGRTENHVNRVGTQFGGHPLAVINKVNIECEIIAMYSNRIKPYPKPEVDRTANDLWSRRIDLTKGQVVKQRHLRVA